MEQVMCPVRDPKTCTHEYILVWSPPPAQPVYCACWKCHHVAWKLK